MSLSLLATSGGHLVLPDRAALLVSASDGGNLVLLPPRPVWERSELSPDELARWGWLVAACGRAMLEVLPQLEGGCLNYWEAGNWALNDAVAPGGRKRARDHRSMHLHLLGRAPNSTDPAWRWGESPRFPNYAERHVWAATHERLTPAECRAIVVAAETLLRARYAFADADIAARGICARCGYPFAIANAAATGTPTRTETEAEPTRCPECRESAG